MKAGVSGPNVSQGLSPTRTVLGNGVVSHWMDEGNSRVSLPW